MSTSATSEASACFARRASMREVRSLSFFSMSRRCSAVGGAGDGGACPARAATVSVKSRQVDFMAVVIIAAGMRLSWQQDAWRNYNPGAAVPLRQNRSPVRKQAVLPVDRGLVREWLAAAERGDLSSLKRHLAAEPRLVDALGRGPYWEGDCRALHYAAYRGHRRVLRWLLARGASVRPITGDGDWAPLHFAAVPAKRDIVRLFLDRGAQMDVFTAAAL